MNQIADHHSLRNNLEVLASLIFLARQTNLDPIQREQYLEEASDKIREMSSHPSLD